MLFQNLVCVGKLTMYSTNYQKFKLEILLLSVKFMTTTEVETGLVDWHRSGRDSSNGQSSR